MQRSLTISSQYRAGAACGGLVMPCRDRPCWGAGGEQYGHRLRERVRGWDDGGHALPQITKMPKKSKGVITAIPSSPDPLDFALPFSLRRWPRWAAELSDALRPGERPAAAAGPLLGWSWLGASCSESCRLHADCSAVGSTHGALGKYVSYMKPKSPDARISLNAHSIARFTHGSEGTLVTHPPPIKNREPPPISKSQL